MLTGWLALSQEERDRYGEIMNDYSNEDEEFKQGQDESLEGFTTRLTQKATNMVSADAFSLSSSLTTWLTDDLLAR